MNEGGGVTSTTSADGSRASIRMFHHKGNILTERMVKLLRSALGTLRGNPHLKFVTIAADGPDFCFGASIPEHAPGEIDRVLPETHALIYELLDSPAVTAAVVRGRCRGGGFELALACDFIFAGSSATFGLPEIALGVFPPAASALLPARAGAARATSAILTGRAAPAADWRAAGLVEAIAADDSLDDAVNGWFDTHLSGRSAAALRHAVAAARLGLKRHVHAVLPELERLYLSDLMRTHDAAEGIAAFLEKRAPLWTDG